MRTTRLRRFLDGFHIFICLILLGQDFVVKTGFYSLQMNKGYK